MRTKFARISYLLCKSGTILVKKGPIACIRYLIKGIYNHRSPFASAAHAFHVTTADMTRILFHRGPLEFMKHLWLLAHSKKYKPYLQIKVADATIFQVTADLVQRNLANRVWKQGKNRSPFSVLFVTSVDEASTARYRVDNICEQLSKQGIQTCILYNFEIHEHLEEALAFDILVFQRLPMDPSAGYFLSQAHERMAALVFEIDDYIFEPSVYLGHDSVKQTSPANKAFIATRSIHLRETLLACDYFIGTTATLADAASDLGRTSFVIRNGLNDRQVALAEKVLKRRSHQQTADGIIRVGYQPGSPTHRQNFAVALPALIRILETFSHVKLVIQGFLKIPEVLQPFQERIERWPYVPWEKLVAMTAQLDLAIAPLEPHSLINEAKSALKYFESGLVQVPVVASPTEDFRTAIRHGSNGFLADTEEEWYESLRLLITDSSLRRQMGIAARQDVLAQYTSTAQSEHTRAVFQAILHQQALRRGQGLPQVTSISGRGR